MEFPSPWLSWVRMERYIAELKSVPLAQGFEEIVYPCAPEAHNEVRRRAESSAEGRCVDW